MAMAVKVENDVTKNMLWSSMTKQIVGIAVTASCVKICKWCVNNCRWRGEGSSKFGKSEIVSSSMRGEVNRECIMDFARWVTTKNTLPSGLAIEPTFGKRGSI
jgi:hypothetical protein